MDEIKSCQVGNKFNVNCMKKELNFRCRKIFDGKSDCPFYNTASLRAYEKIRSFQRAIKHQMKFCVGKEGQIRIIGEVDEWMFQTHPNVYPSGICWDNCKTNEYYRYRVGVPNVVCKELSTVISKSDELLTSKYHQFIPVYDKILECEKIQKLYATKLREYNKLIELKNLVIREYGCKSGFERKSIPGYLYERIAHFNPDFISDYRKIDDPDATLHSSHIKCDETPELIQQIDIRIKNHFI